MAEKFIQKALSKPGAKGALHRKLHVPAGTKIPKAKIMKAEKSKNPKLRKEAVLAETLSKLRKK